MRKEAGLQLESVTHSPAPPKHDQAFEMINNGPPAKRKGHPHSQNTLCVQKSTYTRPQLLDFETEVMNNVSASIKEGNQTHAPSFLKPSRGSVWE
mgnify:CR=1 FL=1